MMVVHETDNLLKKIIFICVPHSAPNARFHHPKENNQSLLAKLQSNCQTRQR